MMKSSTLEGLVQVIETLYKSSKSTVLLDNQIGASFYTTLGILQPTPYHKCCSTFWENNIIKPFTAIILPFPLSERLICNLLFAYDIYLIACTNRELQDLTNRLTDSSNAYMKWRPALTRLTSWSLDWQLQSRQQHEWSTTQKGKQL